MVKMIVMMMTTTMMTTMMTMMIIVLGCVIAIDVDKDAGVDGDN